jgi:hypothetical protein
VEAAASCDAQASKQASSSTLTTSPGNYKHNITSYDAAAATTTTTKSLQKLDVKSMQ